MKNGLIVDAYGNKDWYLNGQHHREDGPAIERSNGDKAWFLNGKLHREDGPAIEYIDGNKLKKPMEEYWLNGKKITKSEWKKYKLIKDLAGIK